MSTITASRFAGLSRLLASAGLIPAASAAPAAPGEEDEDGEAGDGEGEGEGEGEAAPAPAPEAPTPPAPAPAPEAAPDAPPVANKGPDDYKAGCHDTNVRWAGLLTNADCLANIELATSLMLETDFSAQKIGEMCALKPGGDPAALALLDKGVKPSLSATPRNDGPSGESPGKAAAKKAVADINNRRKPRGERK